MANLSVFQFDSNDVEVVVIEGKPWFNASQSAKALGYGNPAEAVRDHVKAKYSETLDLGRRGKKPVFISEPGLYQLIMRSHLPSAERFQDWVFEVVLPAIRETGSYSIKDKQWQKARLEGKDVRRTFTDAIATYIERHPELSENAKKYMYSNATDALYLKTHGARARKLVEFLDCPKNKLRDCFPSKEILTLSLIEDIAVRLIDIKDINPIEAIKQAVDRALAEGLFSDKYLNG